MTPEQHMTEVFKAAPPLVVTGAHFLGYSLQDWMIFFTIIYTVLQIILLIRRMVTSRRVSDTDPACARDCPAVRRKKP